MPICLWTVLFLNICLTYSKLYLLAAGQVDDLKAKLAAQEIELTQKNEDANKLIQIVGTETEKVSKEKEFADGEEKKVNVIKEEVTKKQISCETDLAKAEPALIAAQEALNTLNKVRPTNQVQIGYFPPTSICQFIAVRYLLYHYNTFMEASLKRCNNDIIVSVEKCSIFRAI